ncbi:MAG: hypothetical protein ABR571_03115 [Jatrophihabitans sp.]|uniref:hypothetical protein n=1 Tax=Jatrophihabitans sp. TaxID=1932789 RepID=UPI0039114C34
MRQDFDAARNVYLDRDPGGVVAQLRHLGAPFVTTARTPQLAAADYLTGYADLLEIEPAQLANLASSPASMPEKAPVEFRYLTEKSQFDMTTVAYQQTVLGLPVFEAGVAVQMKTDPFQVVSSQSTQHLELEVKRPSADAVKRAQSISVGQLATTLGLAARDGGKGQPVRKSLQIERRQLVVYRYDPDRIQRDAPTRAGELPATNGDHADAEPHGALPRLPLPPVPDNVRPGRHYVCVKVDFALALPQAGTLHWTAILDVETLAALHVRAYVDDVNGLVFDVDPVTDANGPGPTGTSAALNPIRVSQPLLGLDAPSNGVQALTGDTVALIDSETPTIAAPTEPTGTNFDFDARTDNFSAVNAYVHCDRFFRIVDSMGFTRSSYFGGTTFPTSVDFRGFDSVSPPNAHCVGTAGGTGIARTTFHLADGSDTAHPIGLADDFRVVLHELGGHGVLYNHVSSANFGFSHSAGDSVAAILGDPGSQAPDRFLTFPWVASVISRRHDRLPSGGWGWAGTIALNPFGPADGGGYNNEQILSSTMFRIYRAIGGDSTDLNTKRFAARMTVYLILRAIATLTPATNPSTAAGFETALETADAGDWTSENLTGGAYRKVIRWAFEKQGLFQPAGTATPNNNAGAPPAVDVYIEDGRAGEYQYQPVFWENQSIWNRLAADGGTAHQDPITNRTNYAYVKIKNRGSQTATNVVVKAFHANPAAGLSYPNDWIPMSTAQRTAADVAANNAAEIVVGPFEWTPTHVGHECMFMIVSATGDESNVDHIASGDAIPEWRLVPNDNNIGQRNVAPVPGGTSGLTAEFSDLTFEMKNPLPAAALMQLEHRLPPVLAERGWSLEFRNRGGATMKLASGESRDIVMHLVRGKDFNPADVDAAADRTIYVAARANGILVGGMSYVLDASISRPNRPHGGENPPAGEHGHRHDDTCACHHDERVDGLGALLLQSLQRRRPRVHDVEIKKVIVEIDLEDDDC